MQDLKLKEGATAEKRSKTNRNFFGGIEGVDKKRTQQI